MNWKSLGLESQNVIQIVTQVPNYDCKPSAVVWALTKIDGIRVDNSHDKGSTMSNWAELPE